MDLPLYNFLSAYSQDLVLKWISILTISCSYSLIDHWNEVGLVGLAFEAGPKILATEFQCYIVLGFRVSRFNRDNGKETGS